jgi:ProP effector
MTNADVIAKLAQMFPRTFFVVGAARRPLKVGISRDLMAAGTGLSRARVRHALHHYTRSIGYLTAMTVGAARVDLNGEPAGSVTADEAAHAAERLARIRAAIEEKKRAVAAPKPEPVPAPQPQRLGLADLKAAALARRQGGDR